MATSKEYVYQIRGNQLSLVEKDFTTSDGLNYTYTSGSGLDIPSGSTILKSPLSAVTDGIELEYAYSPSYRINDADDTITGSAYTESSGLLQLTIPSSSFAINTYIVISGSNSINGLHQVNAATSSSTSLVLKTKYNGGAVSESFTVSKDISVLGDESSEIDLPSYLSKALVYYVKAKVAEDAMNIEAKEYLMREFRKMLEKHESSKISGPRKVMTGSHAIR